jgi:hypothetical protein
MVREAKTINGAYKAMDPVLTAPSVPRNPDCK